MAQRIRFKKYDEKGNELKPPKSYLNEKIFVEIKDEETFECIFPKCDLWVLDCFDQYRYFVEKTEKKLNNSEVYKNKKIEFLKENEQNFDSFVKAGKITVAQIKDFTIFQLIDFLNENKVKENKEEKKGK